MHEYPRTRSHWYHGTSVPWNCCCSNGSMGSQTGPSPPCTQNPTCPPIPIADRGEATWSLAASPGEVPRQGGLAGGGILAHNQGRRPALAAAPPRASSLGCTRLAAAGCCEMVFALLPAAPQLSFGQLSGIAS